MSPYVGGSAPAMASQVADGYTLITAMQLKRLTDPELDQFQFEVEKLLRDLRAQQVPLEDIAAIQLKNRKMSRLVNAIAQIQATLAKRRRGG